MSIMPQLIHSFFHILWKSLFGWRLRRQSATDLVTDSVDIGPDFERRSGVVRKGPVGPKVIRRHLHLGSPRKPKVIRRKPKGSYLLFARCSGTSTSIELTDTDCLKSWEPGFTIFKTSVKES